MTEELRSKITSAEQRRATLNGDLDRAVREHEKAKAELLKNQGDEPLNAVTIAHSRRVAVEEAISALDLAIEQDRQLLFKQESKEALDTALARIEACKRESEQAAESYRLSRIEAHRALERTVSPAYESLKRWHELRRELRQLQASVGEAPDRLVDRIDGVETLHPFGGIVDAAISVVSEGFRRNQTESLRREAQKRREQAEQRESDRINALYKAAAERAHHSLRIDSAA